METENNKLVPVLLIALLSTIVGTVLWAVIGIIFNYEVGIIAWALGFISGYAVGMVAKEKVNSVHQVIAVIAALIGIVLGKFATFAYSYNGETIGGIFDSEMISVFQKNLSVFFGGFDILFVILAVITAWQIPLQFKHDDKNKDDIHEHIKDRSEKNS